MTEEKQFKIAAGKELKIVVLPEDNASQISAAQFEPEDNEFVVYFKFVVMTKNAIRNNSHRIENIFGSEKGCLVFGDPEDMRKFLHTMVNGVVDAGKEAAKK